ncbi:MAG: hypothetical protein ACREGA_00750 [Candidatus Saccharimonadales bacterium]
MNQIINQLRQDFPNLSFIEDQNFHWSPQQKQISFNPESIKKPPAIWALLHEIGHGILDHKYYKYDFELLNLEVAAWQQAKILAPSYNQKISDDHIQDCLDSYREWLHRRSTCPVCSNRSLQQNSGEYECLNCHCIWQVSQSRFCRPYRQMHFEGSHLQTKKLQTFFVHL